MVALAISSTPAELLAGARDPRFVQALWLSARTTAVSLVIVVATGTPLAWWIASSRARAVRAVELLVDLPIVIPPAVVGVALLQAFGRKGLLGPALDALGVGLPFTTAAVVTAQIVVSAPFYVQTAAGAFRKVELDTLVVARTLGASPSAAFFRVAIPIALPGLLGGAALAWARSLGEFGATLLFAGNLPGVTQTMPLAIYMALESDVRVALALSLALAAAAAALLLALRAGTGALTRRDRRRP
ncbi:MAG: molybdate ABC transporter permease subunit [Myxococcales bacterium]|nr:molybdate ABC transporter permease subunit [Myxococcales bacterium]